MKNYKILLVLLLGVLFAMISQADVMLEGEIVIQSSSVGAKYLGEITNDTDSPVSDVKITITAKDSEDLVVDVSYGYVDGYNEPGNGYGNTYIPAGMTVPFSFYGDADTEDISSFTYSISYETTDEIDPDFNNVSLHDDLYHSEGFLGSTFYGEIINNIATCIYNVKIVIAIKDKDGKMLEVDFTYVDGENYIYSDILHDESMILPEDTGAFQLFTSSNNEDIGSYYTIINYDKGIETDYQYFGAGQVTPHGNINLTEDVLGDAEYLGEISNNTNRDIYFTSILFISRNSDGKIIDISESYVDGTSYEYSEGSTTDTHISPGEVAPFDVYTSVTYSDVVSYEYKIYYRYADEPIIVEENSPVSFTLKGNYPNPFNPSTTIVFSLSENMEVNLSIYNSIGQKIDTLIDSYMMSGKHEIIWNANDLPTSFYFAVLSAKQYKKSSKMLLLK